MAEVPDGIAEIAIVILAGVIGWMARSLTDLRARVAVCEQRLDTVGDALDRLIGKIERQTQAIADLRVLIAKYTNSPPPTP